MNLRVWIWLLSLSVLWGGSFFFAKVAIGELQPFTVVFAQVGEKPASRVTTYFCLASSTGPNGLSVVPAHADCIDSKVRRPKSIAPSAAIPRPMTRPRTSSG